MNAPLHIEVVQKRPSRASKDHVKGIVHSYLSKFASLSPGAVITTDEIEDHAEIREHVQSISICDMEHDADVRMTSAELVYHVYTLDERGADCDALGAGGDDEASAADAWALPAAEFHGLWDTLVYDCSLKRDALRYAETAFELAARGVDPGLVNCNRVLLLHGPPGTGKTSLCRALAQKLAVRLADRFPRARLLEINAHGLFSRWFSESGKLVARLFERVREVLEDRRLLACVLVDEVESLTHARRAALAGLEPSDSIRAVNAVLTELDRLRRHPNALVLATSNVTGAIDAAFVDRADLRRLVGPPSPRAAYEILRGCCAELAARGLAGGAERAFPLRALEGSRFAATEAAASSLRLWAVAREAGAAGVSARALRRLPLLALALQLPRSPPAPPPPLAGLVAALHDALRQHLRDAAGLEETPA